MYNFDNVAALWETTDWVIDISQYQNNWSFQSAIWWAGIQCEWSFIGNGKWNGATEFNGGNCVLYAGNIKANTWAWGKNTVAFWMYWPWTNNSIPFSRGTGYGLLLKSNCFGFNVYDNKILGISSSGFINQRVYINATFYNGVPDATNNEIYINGVKQTLSNCLWGAMSQSRSASPYVRIGGQPDWNSGFMDWDIDELRIRNRVLTSGQILQMWRSNLTKYDTGNWLFTDDRQCVLSGTYIYTWYVLSTAQASATTGRKTIISIDNRNPIAPTYYFIGSTQVTTNTNYLSWQFTWHFKVEDRKWTSWWYTTIQSSVRFTGINYNNYVDYNHVFFRGTGIDTNIVQGTIATNAVYVNPALNSYQTGNIARTYIERDYITWEYSCPNGVYGNKPYIQIEIPGYQSPDTYSGWAEIYLYD